MSWESHSDILDEAFMEQLIHQHSVLENSRLVKLVENVFFFSPLNVIHYHPITNKIQNTISFGFF